MRILICRLTADVNRNNPFGKVSIIGSTHHQFPTNETSRIDLHEMTVKRVFFSVEFSEKIIPSLLGGQPCLKMGLFFSYFVAMGYPVLKMGLFFFIFPPVRNCNSCAILPV